MGWGLEEGQKQDGGALVVFTRVSHKEGIKIIHSPPPLQLAIQLGRGWQGAPEMPAELGGLPVLGFMEHPLCAN